MRKARQISRKMINDLEENAKSMTPKSQRGWSNSRRVVSRSRSKSVSFSNQLSSTMIEDDAKMTKARGRAGKSPKSRKGRSKSPRKGRSVSRKRKSVSKTRKTSKNAQFHMAANKSHSLKIC